MTRLMIALSLAAVLAFAPFTDAKSSSSSSSGTTNDGSYQGQIQSVATTNFTIGTRKGHGHRRRGGVKPIVVHYNPDTTTVTVDGTVVHVIDFRVTGKYATVYGTIKNEVLEATSISVTTAAPAHKKKSKSPT